LGLSKVRTHPKRRKKGALKSKGEKGRGLCDSVSNEEKKKGRSISNQFHSKGGNSAWLTREDSWGVLKSGGRLLPEREREDYLESWPDLV